MNTQHIQPEALRLAGALAACSTKGSLGDVAATELRHMHALNQELVEALQLCEGNIDYLLAFAHPKVYGEWLTAVRAAIAKATSQ